MRCRRPEVACYCAHVTPLDTRTRVLVLQHPREHEKAVNTARIAELALTNAAIEVGFDFSERPAVRALLSDPTRPAVLLYPAPDARDLEREPPSGPVTLVVIDGTWHQARSLMRANPWLSTLPRYAFRPEAPSEYRIRREPRPEYVSTIEALACALGLLEGDRARFEALLAPFRAMVETQLAYAARSPGGRKRLRRRHDVTAPARLPPLLTERELVCVVGEANAWPYDRTLGKPRYPHELVHWLAYRVSDGACLELFVRPRAPLAASPITHSRLSADALAQGISVEALLTRFREFGGARPVICAWGPYGPSLYARELGAPFERFIDVRKTVGDYLKRQPGSLEALVAERALGWETLGCGRGGERLGMLVAATRWLAEEALRSADRAADMRETRSSPTL